MVKAMKRKDVPLEASTQKKKNKDTKIKIGSILMMVLLFFGFTIAAYWGFSPTNAPPEDPTDNQPVYEFGLGTASGVEEGSIIENTGNLAIFGQLDVPQDLERRLRGELYLLDDGLTHLIFTNFSESEIRDQASGSYIVYTIADCGNFDCLYEDEAPNGTSIYDIYELDKESDFLKTMRVGFLNG